MKYVRWLLLLSEKNPLKFAISLLLMAIVGLVAVVKYQERKIMACEDYGKRRLDSLDAVYRVREEMQNRRIEQFVNMLLEDYKKQIEEQKILKEVIDRTLNANEKVLNRNKNQLKILNND